MQVRKTAEILSQKDNILILMHRLPDGDTIGSALALCYALRKTGKKANVKCSDRIPPKYGYIYDCYKELDFEPEYIVTSDVADTALLGGLEELYADKIDMRIDHHVSGKDFAPVSLVVHESASNCEIMYDVVSELLSMYNQKIDKLIADCLYTGICTDTGCFKFSNTTPSTHIKAAKLIELGCDYYEINRIMYESKSKSRLIVEQYVYNNLKFFFDDRCAYIYLPLDVVRNSGVDDGELDGIASMPKTIEGVKVAVTVRERKEGFKKVSLRTTPDIDASAICAKFGGGGHVCAAGCTFYRDIDEVEQLIVDEIGQVLNKQV